MSRTGPKLIHTTAQLPFSIVEKGTQNIVALTALQTISTPLERLSEAVTKDADQDIGFRVDP